LGEKGTDVEFKDVTDTVYDLTRAGLVIGRKAAKRAFADERYVEPGLVSTLVDRLHPSRVPAEVSEIIEETGTTKTLRLKPTEGAFAPFRAGQFVNLFVEVDGVPTSRPYSISSPPSRNDYYDVTVREMPDGFVSKHLCSAVQAGDRLEVSGPAGFFYHEPLTDTDDLVFLAGGSGITPFMSMIRNAVDTDRDIRMHVLYGSRAPGDIIFGEELADLACCFDGLKVDLVISEPTEGYEGACGLLDAEMMEKLLGDLNGKTFYMCGPHAMYDLCLGSLDRLGVPGRRVKRELSGPPPDITAVEGWPKNLNGTEEFQVKVEGVRGKLTVKSGEPLLNSLERNKLAVDNLCRSGECGACRTRLVDGEVYMPPTVTVRKADLAFGYIHPCMSYPISDLTIRLPR
jgi:glycine betaine catabolism B